MKKAVIYARFSSDNQRIESIDAQLRACRDYCQNKKYVIANEFTDEALSARSDDRPAFQRMVQAAKAGQFDILVCHKLDRFSRDRYDYAHYKRLLNRAGVQIEYVEQKIDGSPESIILESVLSGMAEYYSKNLAKEVMKGMNENAYSAKWNGGVPPIGYDVGPDRKLVINEKEAAIIRTIFQMRADGATFSDIIIALDNMGARTKSGGKIKQSSLHDILANEKYIGVYEFGKVAGGRNTKRNSHEKSESRIRIEGAVPPIIDMGTWERVRDKSYKRARQSNQREIYLLSGLVKCGECEGPMSGGRVTSRGNLYAYYRCNKNKSHADNCGNNRIKKQDIEEIVLRHLWEFLVPEENRAALLDDIAEHQAEMIDSQSGEMATISSEIDDLAKRSDNLLAMMEQGLATATIGLRLQEIEHRQAALVARQQAIDLHRGELLNREQMNDFLVECAADLENKENGPEQVRAIIELFVESVVVYKEEVKVNFRFAPSWWRRAEPDTAQNIPVQIDYKWHATAARPVYSAGKLVV